MFKKIRHKRLARFFESLPGFRLHQLKGERNGQWAVSVPAA
jgi:hypothetical protein